MKNTPRIFILALVGALVWITAMFLMLIDVTQNTHDTLLRERAELKNQPVKDPTLTTDGS